MRSLILNTMSANRARKPPAANAPAPKKRMKAPMEAPMEAPGKPTALLPAPEHRAEARVPEDTELSPIASNDFWDESILDQIVKATNVYALAKRRPPPPPPPHAACAADEPIRTLQRQRTWKPLNKADLRRFISITTLISAVRLPSHRLYWSFSHGGILSKFGLSFDRYSQIKRYLRRSMPTTTPLLPCKDWWQKFESLSPSSSHHRQRTRPSTHVATDEMRRSCSCSVHELRRDRSANKPRLEVAEHRRLPGPASSNLKKPRIRTTYQKKTTKIYFSKHRRLVAAQAAVERGPGGDSGSHRLVKITKRRECIVCRSDFRDGRRGGRQRPQLTQFECPECSPPVALCKPEGGACFSRWHDIST